MRMENQSGDGKLNWNGNWIETVSIGTVVYYRDLWSY